MRTKLFMILTIGIFFLLLGGLAESQLTPGIRADDIPIGITIGELQLAKQPDSSASTGPTVINFDDLVTKGSGTGGPYIPVTDQYQAQGVTFENAAVIDFSEGIATQGFANSGIIPGFAHSGTNAIECHPLKPDGFCLNQIIINFSERQSRVKVWVGIDPESTSTHTYEVGLLAFNSAGRQIAYGQGEKPIGPGPIKTSFEVSTLDTRGGLFGRPDIASVTVFVYNPYNPDTHEVARLAVDDVEFERVEGMRGDVPDRAIGAHSHESPVDSETVPRE